MQGEQLKLNLDYLMMHQHLAVVHDEDDDGYIALLGLLLSQEPRRSP